MHSQVEDQMRILVESLQLDEEALTQREAIRQEIQDVLTEYLPHTTVQLFGSSASGQ